ncbi:chitosanase [Streptomyces albidoflavus]
MTRREAGAALLGLAALAACSGEASGAGGPGLDTPRKKESAMRLVSSAENSSLAWRAQYRYIEDIGDGRGYTAGIIGFCSGTGDMPALVERYARERPDAELAGFLPALREVRGSDSHRGLGSRFTRPGSGRPTVTRPSGDAQDGERDRVYFAPAVARGKQDGLGALRQFCYYDARVMHGHGDAPGNVGFATIRRRALDTARPP